MDRGAVEVEDLLKVVLILIAVWLVLEILGEFLEITLGIFGWLRPIIGLVLLLLIALWLLDRL